MDESTKELIDVLVGQSNVYKDTLFWAIGVMLTLITIFFGANFFTMRSVRKEEIARIRSEIELSIRNEFMTKFKDEITNEIESKLETKISIHDRNIASLRERAKRIEDRIKSENSISLRNVNLLKADVYTLQGEFYTDKEIYASALSSYLMAANIYLDYDYTIHLSGLLDDIEKSIEKIKQLDNWEKESVQKVLNKLTDNFTASKESIQKKLF